jgi:hypothetical protein
MWDETGMKHREDTDLTQSTYLYVLVLLMIECSDDAVIEWV